MGNSASEIISKVSSSTSEDLQNLLNQDIELLQDANFVYSSSKLSLRTDLAKYSVPYIQGKEEEKALLGTEDEQSLVISQSYTGSSKERREQVLQSLTKNISRNREVDIASEEFSKRLQAFCRVFEAVLRSAELKGRKESQGKEENVVSKLPPTARSAIKFGLNTLLCLVECVAVMSPEIYDLVVKDASEILQEIGPLSMVTGDVALVTAFADIAKFFDGVVLGSLPGLSEEKRLHSFKPLVRLALATGSTDLFVTISSRLLEINSLCPDPESNSKFMQDLLPSMQELNKLKPYNMLYEWSEKNKSDRIILNEQKTIAEVKGGGPINIYSGFQFLVDKFYFEVKVHTTNDSCFFGVCDSAFNTASGHHGTTFSASYKSSSEIYIKNDTNVKHEAWKSGDLIGVFVDVSAKKFTFYKNGAKMPGNELSFTSESLTVFMVLNEECKFEINTQPVYPPDLKSMTGASSPSEVEGLISQDPVSPDYFSKTGSDLSLFVLEKLESLVLPFEYLLEGNYRFDKERPCLGVNFNKATVVCLFDLQRNLMGKLRDDLKQDGIKKALRIVLKLMQFHLRIAKDLDDRSLDFELKQQILQSTCSILTDFEDLELTSVAGQIVSSSFEVFYRGPKEKMNYIINSLEKMKNHEESLKILSDMELDIYSEMARADKIFPAILLNSDEDEETVKKLYTLLIDLSEEVSVKSLSSDQSNSSIVKLFESVQSALLAQSCKSLFKDRWESILKHYISHFLSSCERVASVVVNDYSCKEIPENTLKSIENSMISRPLMYLLDSLILSPLTLDLIALVLPRVKNLFKSLSSIPTPPSQLVLGLGIIESVYESPHNYPDSANLTHTVKTPGALKYNLTFDPQCKTENGCDYLELWLDEAASNKFARWEGENFPKEPVEVNNSILHFTFRSDGSVNYWGWKITIKAIVQNSFFQKQWPATLCSTIEHFLAICAGKLVNGEFCGQVNEDVVNLMKNPLFKYGVSDSSSLLVKELPAIDSDLVSIITCFAKDEQKLDQQLALLTYQKPESASLSEYLTSYAGLQPSMDHSFLSQLIEGEAKLNESWAALKKRSGVIGAAATIGGKDLDQAEKAVFAVYSAFFEISETIKLIFEDINNAGPTVKMIVKQSCNIRVWAQKHKQHLMDSGNSDITYKNINEDIVKKCWFLLGTGFKQSLADIGISRVMKNLLTNIAKTDKKGLKLGSKWKAVQSAMKNVGKLKSLVSIKKAANEAPNEDNKEFSRVAELVTSFLEQQLTLDKVVESLQVNRVRALSRSVGLLAISDLLENSKSLNTFMVSSFIREFSASELKKHYSEGLEGIDPSLMQIVQGSYFKVYCNLQRNLIRYHHKEFSYETFVHFLAVIEALSIPLHSPDTHMLLDQPLIATIKVLIDWATGRIKAKPLTRKFLKEKCITKLGKVTQELTSSHQENIVLETKEGQPSIHLVVDKGTDELPIIDFKLVDTLEENFEGEDAVSSFTFNESEKFILIKRGEIKEGGSYLTSIANDLVPTFTSYSQLLAPENPAEKEKIKKMRQKLCGKSWNLYKQIAFYVLGENEDRNRSQTLAVQDSVLNVIFSELEKYENYKDLDSHLFSLNDLSTGGSWVGESRFSYEKLSSAEEWFMNHHDSAAPAELAALAQTYQEVIDPLLTGKAVLSNAMATQLSTKLASKEISLSTYLDLLKSIEHPSQQLQAFLESHPDFSNESSSSFKNPLDPEHLLAALEGLITPVSENSFSEFLTLLKGTKGQVAKAKLPDTVPAEFKNLTESLDLYQALEAVSSIDRFSVYRQELYEFFKSFTELPANLSQLEVLKKSKRNLTASLLWILYGAFTQYEASSALALEGKLKVLLKFAFDCESVVIKTISMRLLSKIVPAQHSPQSFELIWKEFNRDLPGSGLDMCDQLFKNIGKSLWTNDEFAMAYESQNLMTELLASKRWRAHVVAKIRKNLEEVKAALERQETIKAVHAGTLKFLAFSDSLKVTPFVLAVVQLKECSFAVGVVTEVINATSFKVYSILDDSTAQVEIEKVVNLVPVARVDVKEWFAEQADALVLDLIQILKSLSQVHSFNKLESAATIRTIYLTLETSAVESIQKLLKFSNIQADTLQDLADILLNLAKGAKEVNNQAYLMCSEYVLKALNSMVKSQDELTVEEVKSKVEGFSEEDKTKFNEIVEKGVGEYWTYKCFTKNIKTYDEIVNYVEPITVNQIYRLSVLEESCYKITDVHGTAEIYQNNSFHIVIKDNVDSLKTFAFNVLPNIFNSSLHFLDTLTIRFIVIGKENCEFGFKAGNIDFHVFNSQLKVNSEVLSSHVKPENIVVKIIASSSGSVKIIVENTNESVSLENNFLFDGINLAQFSLYLLKGDFVALAHFSIFDGVINENFPGKVDQPGKMEGGERSVKVKIVPENLDKARLRLLGITESEAETCISKTGSKTESVLYSLKNFQPALPELAFDYPDICITEINLFDSLSSVPSDFKVVPTFENLSKLDFSLANSKVLAYKSSKLEKDKKVVLDVFISENSGGESIGNMTIPESERANEVFIKSCQFTGKEVPLRDLILIKASSLFNLKVPSKFDLVVDKEGKALNLAGKSDKDFYVFLAVNRSLSLFGGTFYPLEKVPITNSSYGLVEVSASASGKVDYESRYSSLKIIELYHELYSFEKAIRGNSSKALLASLLSQHPEHLASLMQSTPLKAVLNLVPWKTCSDFINRSKTVDEKLLLDTLALMLEYISESGTGRGLKALYIESKHPYDNSQDIDDVIQIPGAKRLKIEFDPQCYTESNCDTLRFYENSGRTGELKCFSGQGESNWQSFEVPGDTVYTYFHSDGSVNYWGYKFTVTPTNASKSAETEELIDSKVLFELLLNVVKKGKNQEILFTDKFLAPFYIFLQISQANDEKLKIIEIMKHLFTENLTDLHTKILESFVKTAGKLFQSTKAERKSHSILQGLLILLCKAHSAGKLKVDQHWFLDLSDLLHDMNGLTYKNESLDLFLFESFKKKAKGVAEKEIESEHPYRLKTICTKVQVKGAHSLTLEFSKDCKTEEQHSVHISRDEKGIQDAEQDEGLNTLHAVWDMKGPDVVVDGEDKRVTRTNSSGWGNTFSNLKLEKGIFSVTVFVESTGDSAYLYIGFIEANENGTYDLSTCLNNGHPQRVWTWKKSGEFNEKGSDTGNVSYESGDTLTFIVNTYTKTITCYKNTIEVWTFRNISDSVIMGSSFGGSNQFIVLRKVERVKGGKLEDKIVSITGDTAYVWFPVFSSGKLQYSFDAVSDDSVSISPNRLLATSKTEQLVVVPLSNQIVAGKYFAQVKWIKGRCDFGIAPVAVIPEKNVNDQYLISGNSEWKEGDVVGCFVDTYAGIVTFWVAGEKAKSLSLGLPAQPHKFVVVLHGAESALEVVMGKPEEMDLLTVDSPETSSESGFKAKVVPHYKGRSSESVSSFLSSGSEDFRSEWSSYKEKYSGAFKSTACEELITYIDRLAASKSKDPLTLPVDEVDPTESELVFYPELEKLSKDQIKTLFSILQDFNKRVEEFLFLFDLQITENLTDMQKVLLGCRNFIFFSYKNSMLKKALDQTKSEIRTEFTIDRPKAARHRNKKEVDTEAQFSITGQIYRAMSAVNNQGYRNAERIYKINYRGEASIDAGGPYNESMSNICDELQSSFLHLFIPTANHVGNMGENREAWTINPTANSAIDLELYTFIGKLMGAAIRTQNNLGLSLPPLFWKKLIHEPVTLADLRGVDVCQVQIIEMLKKPEAHDLTPENFEMAYDEKFVAKDSSGREVELVPGGKDLTVTYDNCSEYADLVGKMRLGESDKAIRKIREGISAVVQIDLLNLFSWRQVETLVCGTVDVDVDILKENTDYDGCGLSDQHIQYFWEVLREFSQIERSLFLKFVWGRKRLPSGKDWRHMKVTRYNPSGPVNNYMPVSHTCFFTLDLPAYTTKEAMRVKLTYAITHCTAIDLDGSAGAGWEEND